FLEALYDAAADGSQPLLCPTLSLIRSGNLRTPMRRIIERAGLVPWERTFQNLRSSFVIDLHERFPAHVAAAWAGHTERTARGHYLAVQDEHFERAATGGPLALQKALQQVSEPGCTGVQPSNELHGKTGPCTPVQGELMAPA
ncbi:MAG TPA: hypothetical protein VKD90_03615, partial [Gemmataceae bacterium]|nr:hypothetical protein [Gemmataceae bacterium]